MGIQLLRNFGQAKMNGTTEQVSFKVILRGSDDSKSQVRRFVVPQDCSTSLVYLKEKLRSIFGPTLGNFRLSWKDEDGDDVIIETDEELMIGLQEMKGPLYKLDLTSRVSRTSRRAFWCDL